MWNQIPSDILSHIFSYLPPDSLARASSVSNFWHASASSTAISRHTQPWFIAFPTQNRHLCCYAYSPPSPSYVYNPPAPAGHWYVLPLNFLRSQIRPISALDNGLILSRHMTPLTLHLTILNPFTRQFTDLPPLTIPRTNPAVSLVRLRPNSLGPPRYRVFVAGGTTTSAAHGGVVYECSVEMYDSESRVWEMLGSPVPREIAVRLTVWTPNDSVSADGVIYWITPAKAYKIVGFEVESGGGKWVDVAVPVAERLEFAALVDIEGRVVLVGATREEGGMVWEMRRGKRVGWDLVENMPEEMGRRLVMGVNSGGGWDGVKCIAGEGGAVCFYRDLETGMVVWRAGDDGDSGGGMYEKWRWVWVDGFRSRKLESETAPNLSIRGLLLHPRVVVP